MTTPVKRGIYGLHSPSARANAFKDFLQKNYDLTNIVKASSLMDITQFLYLKFDFLLHNESGDPPSRLVKEEMQKAAKHFIIEVSNDFEPTSEKEPTLEPLPYIPYTYKP